MRIKCESCGCKTLKRDLLCIECDGVRHYVCRVCIGNSECIQIMKPYDDEIQLAGSFELRDGEVVCELPDFGFNDFYAEGD